MYVQYVCTYVHVSPDTVPSPPARAAIEAEAEFELRAAMLSRILYSVLCPDDPLSPICS